MTVTEYQHTDDDAGEPPPPWVDPLPDDEVEARRAIIDAEVAVLGAAMGLSPAAAYDEATSAGVTVDTFAVPGHRDVWQAIGTLYDQGDPINHQTVSTILAADGKLAGVGGPGMVLSFTAGGALPSQLAFYIGRIREAHFRRNVRTILADAQRLLDKPQADAAVIASSLQSTIEELVVHTGRTETTWRARDLTAALDGTREGPTPTILTRTDGAALLYPGRTHAFVGEPESGKSWLALLAILQVINAGRVATMFDFEDDEHGIVTRLLAMGAAPETIASRFRYARVDDPLGAAEGRDLDDELAHSPELVVIDGVTEALTLHGWNGDKAGDIAEFQRRIMRRIARTGPAVVVIDHVTKNVETRGRWGAGSQHKLAGIDGAQYTIDRKQPWSPGHSGAAKISVAKDRSGAVRAACPDRASIGDLVVTAWPDGTIDLTVEPAKALRAAGDGGFRPTHLMERVSAFLAAHPDDDHSGRAVTSSVTGDDKSIARALVVLADEGYVTVTTVGKARYHKHKTTYTEDMEDT